MAVRIPPIGGRGTAHFYIRVLYLLLMKLEVSLEDLLENGIITHTDIKGGIARSKTPIKQLIDFGGFLTTTANIILKKKYGLFLFYAIGFISILTLSALYAILLPFAPGIRLFFPDLNFLIFYALFFIVFSMYISQIVEGTEREKAYILFFLLNGKMHISLNHLQLSIMKMAMKCSMNARDIKDKLVSTELKGKRVKYARERVNDNIRKLLGVGLLEARGGTLVYMPLTFHITGIENKRQEELSSYLGALWDKRIKLINEESAIIKK